MEYKRNGLKSERIASLISQVDSLGDSGVEGELVKSLIKQGNMPIGILQTFARNIDFSSSKKGLDFSGAQFVEGVAEVCTLVGEGITCEAGREVKNFPSR